MFKHMEPTCQAIACVPVILLKQGGFAELQGGDFGSSFLSGFTGSIAGSMITAKSGDESFFGAKNEGGKYLARRTVAAAVVGGTTSEIAGGKFANGAATAAMVHLLNHENVFRVNKEERIRIEVTTAIREPDPQVGMKSTQIATIDLAKGQIVTSLDYTGDTIVGPLKIQSTRDDFKVFATNTDEVMNIYMVGQTATGIKVLPNINYSIGISINRISGIVTPFGSHDGYPSYTISVNGRELYDFQQTSLHRLLGDDDTKISVGGGAN